MAEPVPPRVREYADQAVAYVQRALGITLEYDSNTLPVLDHYLRSVPDDQPAALELVVATSGAYFGEVVRQLLGGRWDLTGETMGVADGEGDAQWRVVLPTGLHFSPAGFVAAAIAREDLEDLDSEIAAPPRLRPYVQQALARMGEVSVDDYYSLCGRLDTLEHIHEVLVAVAAQMLGDDDLDDETTAERGEPVGLAALADDEAEPSDPAVIEDELDDIDDLDDEDDEDADDEPHSAVN